MTAAVRRLARCIYSDMLVCVCGQLLPVRFMAAVGSRPADAYAQSLTCSRCAASWALVLSPRDYPHLRIKRVDRSAP